MPKKPAEHFTAHQLHYLGEKSGGILGAVGAMCGYGDDDDDMEALFAMRPSSDKLKSGDTRTVTCLEYLLKTLQTCTKMTKEAIARAKAETN